MAAPAGAVLATSATLMVPCPWAPEALAMHAPEDLPPGVTEAYLHPAVQSDGWRAMAPGREQRVGDHRALVGDPEMADALRRAGVEPVGYRALRDLMQGRWSRGDLGR